MSFLNTSSTHDTTLDVLKAGQLMNVHPQTVLNLIGRGVIPAGKIGRTYILLRSDVMAHIHNIIVKQTAERMGGAPRVKRRSPQFAG